MTRVMSLVSRRVPSAVRLALVIVVCLAGAVAPAPALAQRPTGGTEILWDRYGVPHIFARLRRHFLTQDIRPAG